MTTIATHWKRKTILFLVSQGITLFGSTLVQMAVIWFVTLKTSSGAWVFALTACSFVPQLIISFFAGVWADRHSRKALIILADSVIALATLALACALPYLETTAAALPAILIVSVIRSLGAGVQTPAVNAVIPQLVPEEHLMRFNGINASLQSVIQFASPAAAGALLAVGSLRWVLLVDVATAAVGVGLLTAIAVPCLARSNDEAAVSMWRDLCLGVRYAFGERPLRRLLLIYGAFIFLSVPSGFLSALLVTRTFGESYLYLTVVEMVGFVGMTAGGLLLGVWGGFKDRSRTLGWGLALYGLFAVMLGLCGHFVLFAVVMFCLCLAIPVVQTAVVTMLQEQADPEKQGRVFGLLSAMYSGFLPLGMALFGPLADVVSVQTLMLVTGAFLILTVPLLAVTKRRAG